MAFLYHHTSLPLSPPHQPTAPEPPRAPTHSPRIPALPSSSHHVSALPRPAATASAFACHCKAPARDNDAALLRALQSNGNGTLHGNPAPAQVLDARSDGPGGDGRSKRPRLCARDCAKRIMELPEEERVKVLDLLQRDDAALTVSDYNDILLALARGGDHGSAVALFRAMPVAPDAHSFATAVQCLCRQGAPDEAKLALEEMVARGFRPSVATFSAVVGCLCKRGRVTKAMEVFDAMRALGCEPTIRNYNSLIGGLCFVGRLEEALDLLNKLKDSPNTPVGAQGLLLRRSDRSLALTLAGSPRKKKNSAQTRCSMFWRRTPRPPLQPVCWLVLSHLDSAHVQWGGWWLFIAARLSSTPVDFAMTASSAVRAVETPSPALCAHAQRPSAAPATTPTIHDCVHTHVLALPPASPAPARAISCSLVVTRLRTWRAH